MQATMGTQVENASRKQRSQKKKKNFLRRASNKPVPSFAEVLQQEIEKRKLATRDEVAAKHTLFLAELHEYETSASGQNTN
jgi:hypothetical protein